MIKYGLIACLLCILFPAFPASGDDLALSADYESLTLRLYNEQKWDSLLVVGEEAIGKGYDYFYIRVRVGVAAFEKQRYVRAARHLEKALEFNSPDEFASTLLYKSYHYSNRNNEARLLLGRIPEEQASRIGKADRLPILYVETGPAFTNHVEKYGENKQTEPGIYSEVYLNRNSQYLLAGLAQPLGHRFLVHAAAAVLNFNKRRVVNVNFFDHDSGILYAIDSLSGDYKVSEWELYVSPTVILGKHLSISPAFRLINVSLTNPLTSENAIVQGLIGPAVELNYYDYAAGGEITYNHPFLTLSAGAWLLHIDDNEFTQYTTTLFVMPFGNLNLYASATLNQQTSSDDTKYTFNQMLGGKIYGKLWGEAFYTWGDLSNSAEQNAQVVYNAYAVTTSRAGSRLILNINDFLKLSLRYQVYFREGSELFFALDGKSAIFSYNYINQSITGGITWNIH